MQAQSEEGAGFGHGKNQGENPLSEQKQGLKGALRPGSCVHQEKPIAVPGLLRYSGGIMGLLRSLFWFALFLAMTFAFTVLFEHGPGDFLNNAKKESQILQDLYGKKIERKKDESDKLGR